MKIPKLRHTSRACQNFVVEASPDVRNWFPVWTNNVTGAKSTSTDADAAKFSQRFYRVAAK